MFVVLLTVLVPSAADARCTLYNKSNKFRVNNFYSITPSPYREARS